ncbi:hypothetical protein ACRWYJ_23540, partial [Escherichia coli]
PLTDFGGKTSIFSHPVYLFLRKFSLQDSRGGSENMRTINASFSAMQPASEQDDIVNSPNYEDIAVVELQLCISLTVTECDIDSVTGEIV